MIRRFLVQTVLSILILPGLVGSSSAQSQNVPGDLTVGRDIHLREFSLLGGGVIEFPGKLRFGRGGGEGAGLPPSKGRIRAQPGGNLEILPLGDYYRSALDIYPTMGKKPEVDALAELTIHRIHPTNEGHEMLSVTALSDSQQRFALIVEAHGKGRIKPLDLQMIQGGLLEVDKDIKPFNAIAMRVKTDGTAQFSVKRSGGEPGPVDAISIERDNPGDKGGYPSDYLRWTAKRVEQEPQRFDWRVNVQIPESTGSELAIENREGNGSYHKKMKVTAAGDLELPIPAAGVVLTSPNGKKWRLGVTDGGDLKVDPWEGS